MCSGQPGQLAHTALLDGAQLAWMASVPWAWVTCLLQRGGWGDHTSFLSSGRVCVNCYGHCHWPVHPPDSGSRGQGGELLRCVICGSLCPSVCLRFPLHGFCSPAQGQASYCSLACWPSSPALARPGSGRLDHPQGGAGISSLGSRQLPPWHGGHCERPPRMESILTSPRASKQ